MGVRPAGCPAGRPLIGKGGAYSVFEYDASQQRIVHVSRASEEDEGASKKVTIGPFEIVSYVETSQAWNHSAWKSWNWEPWEARIFVSAPGVGMLGIVGCYLGDEEPDEPGGLLYR